MLATLLSRYSLEVPKDAGPVHPVVVASMEPAGLRVQCVPLQSLHPNVGLDSDLQVATTEGATM